MFQVESLETGISDLDEWVQGGEELLNTHRIDNNINILEDRLEKHKVNVIRVYFVNNWCSLRHASECVV